MPSCSASAPGLFCAEDGAKSHRQALPGPPAATTQPQQHLAGPPRTGPPPARKVQGVIFESSQNSARLLHKSPYYSSSVGSKSGGGCTSAGALVGGRVVGEGDARRRCRVPGAGCGRPGRSGSAAREEEEPRRRRRRQFPLSPALAPRAHAHCARSPGPYLSGLLERRRKREFGGVRSGGFRSDPQAV